MDVDTETLTAAGESSTAAETDTRQTTDATTDSSTVTPDANRETSSDSPDAKKPSRLADVLKSATQTLSKGIVEEGEAPAESSTEGTETAEGTREGAGVQKDERTAAAEADTALDAQFHTRPEWKQAVEIGGDKIKPVLRQIFGREAQLNDRLRKAEPEVQSLAKIRSLTGNNETGFKNLNALLETFQSDPAKAVPMLEQLVGDARQRAGLVIQSEDLRREAGKIQQQLKDNLIDQETAEAQYARLVEIEKARAGQKRAEMTVQQARETEVQRQTRTAQQEVANALNTWEESVRQRFPDIGHCTDVNDPNHGESVMDQVFDMISAKAAVNPPKTLAEFTKLAQGCLDQVQKRIGKFLPAGRTMRPLTSQSSSATARVQPKNFQEAEQLARRKLLGG